MNVIFAEMFYLCQLWLLVVKLFPLQWFFEYQYWSQAHTAEPTSTTTQWTGDRCAWAQVTEGRHNNAFKLIFFQSWRTFSLRGFATQPRIYVYIFSIFKIFFDLFYSWNEEQKRDIKTATKLKWRRDEPQSRFPIALVECWTIRMWQALEMKPVLLCKNNNVKLQQWRFWRQCKPTTVIFYSLNLLQRLFLQFSCNFPH